MMDAIYSRLASAEREVRRRYHGREVSLAVRLGSSGYEVERELLVRTVAYARGNKARAADILGMSRGTLYNRLRRYGLPETNGHVNGRAYRNGRNGLT